MAIATACRNDRGQRRARSLAAADVTRRYGEGDSAVHALRGVSLDDPARPVRGRHGPLGLRQVDADAHPRRAGRADVGPGLGRRR